MTDTQEHTGEQMKAVTVYELTLMKERRDALETQRNDLLDALRQIASGAGEFTARALAHTAIEKAEGAQGEGITAHQRQTPPAYHSKG